MMATRGIEQLNHRHAGRLLSSNWSEECQQGTWHNVALTGFVFSAKGALGVVNRGNQ
jgi:hypothetical protein